MCIRNLLLLLGVVLLVTRQCDIRCAWCGRTAEQQPMFVKYLTPLPDVMHFDCVKEWGRSRAPLNYRSYPWGS